MPRINLLTGLAFFSGCCALAYEILYIRALTTLLGDMLHVHAALLSAFLIGIGLGARLAHRAMRWLWSFEVVTGLYALGFPMLTRAFSELPWMISVTGSSSLTALVTGGFLAIPSLMIGFSIPLFSAYIKAASRDRLAFQRVYIAYNLGAAISVLAVEFVLVRALGIQQSLAVVGAINLAIGLILAATRAAPDCGPETTQRRFPARIVMALAIAGVVSAAFQLFFLKLTYLVFAPHRENFALSLSIVLLGICLGAELASRTKIRFATWLAVLPFLIGAIYASWLPLVRLHLAILPAVRDSELLMLLEKFAMGCVFALGPMIVFGALLPALMRSEQDVAGESGKLLFVASLANAVGFLMYVFLGHPLLPSHALLALLAGAALFASWLASDFRWSRAQAAVALVGVGFVTLMIVEWDDRRFYLAQWADLDNGTDEVITFKSGSDNVTLVRTPQREWITYNGHASINPWIGDSAEIGEAVSGIIPALSAPRLDRAMVLGFGAGLTSGAAALSFEHTDVVEITEAFYEMIPLMSRVNFGIADNPNVTLHHADGRAFLIGKDESYDAIINAIPAPTYYSAGKIYTLEFYERVKRALKPGGVFSTWVSTGDMSKEGLMLVLTGLHRSFRYCDLYLMSAGYYTTNCSNQPIQPRRFSELPAPSRLLETIGFVFDVLDPDEFFADIRVSENIFDHFEPNVEQPNTDDHPVFEFAVVRNYQSRSIRGELFLMRQELLNIDPVRLDPSEERARFIRRAAAFRRVDPRIFEHYFQPLL